MKYYTHEGIYVYLPLCPLDPTLSPLTYILTMTEQSAKVSAPRSHTPPPNPIQPKQPVHSTPVRPKLTVHTAFAIEAPVMEKAQARLVNETQGHYVGPMPPHLFVDQFMPWNDKTPKRFRNLEPSAERITTLQSMAGLPESQRYAKIVSHHRFHLLILLNFVVRLALCLAGRTIVLGRRLTSSALSNSRIVTATGTWRVVRLESTSRDIISLDLVFPAKPVKSWTLPTLRCGGRIKGKQVRMLSSMDR